MIVETIIYYYAQLSSFERGLKLLIRRVAQFVSALPSVVEVPSLIFSDTNFYFDFTLIRVALALNTRNTKH